MRGGGRRGGGGAPEAGKDGAEEEDGAAAAETRFSGRPGQVGEEAARVPGADGGGPAAWRGRGCWRISGARRRQRIPWGRGRGAPRKRRTARMTAAAEEEEATTTTADRGRKSG
jgi:hypothetical protein